MPIRMPVKPAGRAPQRSNGVRRREAILNAAAEIISESGIAGLTLHATARQAKSSIGSMYHFFSDKDQLLDALRVRHREAMAEILSSVSSIDTQTWKTMSPAEVIDALFGRPIKYYSDHPFALELHQLREGHAIDEFMALVEAVMIQRSGNERGPRIAKMLYAVSTGTLAFALDVRDKSQRVMVAEIPAVLATYLAAEEAMASDPSPD